MEKSLQNINFNNRSDYEWTIEDNIILIEDLNNGKSVTNDMENVLNDIIIMIGEIKDKKVIYKDSMGIWDGVHHSSGGRISFYSIGETSRVKAKLKVK